MDKFEPVIDEKRHDEFNKLTEPLIEWLCKNYHPHSQIIIEQTHAELVEGVINNPVGDKYL